MVTAPLIHALSLWLQRQGYTYTAMTNRWRGPDGYSVNRHRIRYICRTLAPGVQLTDADLRDLAHHIDP